MEPLVPGRKRQIGDLTIRGTTHEFTLDTTLEGRITDPYGRERMGLSAETQIDHHDFGLNWNVALEAGGPMVSDEVKISIEVEAIRRE